MLDHFLLTDTLTLVALAANTAVQAAFSFLLGFFRRIANIDFPEILLALTGRSMLGRHPLDRVVIHAGMIGHTQFLLLGLLPAIPDIFFIEVTVNRFRRFMAGSHRRHHRCRTVSHIATGENPLAGGLFSQVVDLHDAGPQHFHAGYFRDERQVGCLADGHDHRIAIDNLSFLFVKLRVKSLVSIKNAGTFFKFNGDNFAVLAVDLLRTPGRVDLDAFIDGFFDFPGVGRHFAPAFQAEQMHFFRTGTQRYPGVINRHVTAANNHHFFTQDRFLAQMNVTQEVHPEQNTVKIGAFDG